MTIVVTGDTGFLGTHLLESLKENRIEFIESQGRKYYDFTNFEDCKSFLAKTKASKVIHLAALSGGIGANRARPDEFFYTNLMLVANMFKAASVSGVGELIYTFGGCSYPNSAESPIMESDLWNGIPHGDSAAYSIAKKMGVIAAAAYSKSGLQSKLLIPGNLYGEFDNFSLEDSHVIPAMIRKVYEAKINGANEIVFWGDGTPTRDFVYAGDVAKAIVQIIDMEIGEEPMNISSGVAVSIRELADLVCSIIGFTGQKKWDTTKPNGQQNKIFSVDRAKSFGINCETNLIQGLSKTIDWFCQNYERTPEKVRL